MNILSQCKRNDVVGIVYGDSPQERIARVLEVRDLKKNPLAKSTRRNVDRTNILITCQDTYGQIRSFYAGKEVSSRRIPMLKVAFMAVKNKLPKRK